MLDYLWNWADPGFLAPAWLVAGVVAVVILVWLEARTHALRQQALRLFTAPHLAASLVANVSTLRRAIKALLLL
jgi:hypothetical protein